MCVSHFFGVVRKNSSSKNSLSRSADREGEFFYDFFVRDLLLENLVTLPSQGHTQKLASLPRDRTCLKTSINA